jgi:hypothetical protein
MDTKLSFQCEQCNQPNDIEISSDTFELVGTDPDRGMGTEYAYESSNEFSCDKCGKDMEITVQVWEYPIGAYNYHEISKNGIKNLTTDNNFMDVLYEVCQKNL